MVRQGYQIEKTGPRNWYVTSKKFGHVLGPFPKMAWAIDYAKRIDG